MKEKILIIEDDFTIQTHLTVLPEKEWLSANTMQEGTRLFGTLPFLLYTGDTDRNKGYRII